MSRRRWPIKTALLLSLLCDASAFAQAPTEEAQVKAAFIYNFLKFVEWPESTFRGRRDTLVVAIVGDGATADATEKFLATKQLGERPLVTRRLKWDQPLAGVHAVLVTEGNPQRRRRVLLAATEAAVLTIGEGEAFAAQGGVIGLVIENRRVRFDIHTGSAEAAGLRVSSKLLALTRVVHSTSNGSGTPPW